MRNTIIIIGMISLFWLAHEITQKVNADKSVAQSLETISNHCLRK